VAPKLDLLIFSLLNNENRKNSYDLSLHPEKNETMTELIFLRTHFAKDIYILL